MAILKRVLLDRLGEIQNKFSGAALEFASGQALLLLSPDSSSRGNNFPIRVRQLAGNRFEIELDSDEEQVVDEVTAAFLRLKRDQFQRGLLELSPPQSADAWCEAANAATRDADAALDSALQRVTAKPRKKAVRKRGETAERPPRSNDA